MSIIPDTIRKQKEYIADSNGNHTLVSRWTSAETVEMPNGEPLSEYNFTDDKVKQTQSDTSTSTYELLFSELTSDTTQTTGARKSKYLTYNPNNNKLSLITQNSGSVSLSTSSSGNELDVKTSENNRVYAQAGITGASLTVKSNVGTPSVGITTTNSNGQQISQMSLRSNDINLYGTNNTWDGTNTSLKAAIAAAASQGGNVEDVMVNGISVVDANHVAQIKSYKEITQAEYDALTPAEKNNGTLYAITDGQGGGGGTTVVANPSGTATADLDKLQVGNVIYDIPSGSGGYTETVLFNGFHNDTSDITLSSDITQFDAIIIETCYHETYVGDFYCHYGNAILSKDVILKARTEYDTNYSYKGLVSFSTSECDISHTMHWAILLSSTTTIKFFNKDTRDWSVSSCGISKIIGVKH